MNTSEVFGPKHHGGSDDPFETIKVLEHWLTPDEMIGFCKGQSIVYQRRHREKGGLTDLAKSAWYTNYLVKYLASRGLSAFGPTSSPPEKSEPRTEPKSGPQSPEQQPVPPASGGGDPAPQPVVEPLQPADPGLGAGAAADTEAFPGSLEADMAALTTSLAPVRTEQAA